MESNDGMFLNYMILFCNIITIYTKYDDGTIFVKYCAIFLDNRKKWKYNKYVINMC